MTTTEEKIEPAPEPKPLRTALEVFAPVKPLPKGTPEGLIWGFRACRPDLRSRNGFRWAWPGNWTVAQGPFLDHKGPCPNEEGDGICIAKTASGAASGGFPLITVLIVGYKKADILGEDEHKVRVKRAYVFDVVDGTKINLYGAALTGADLTGAALTRANLTGADLTGANYSKYTQWPLEFNPAAHAELILVDC